MHVQHIFFPCKLYQNKTLFHILSYLSASNSPAASLISWVFCKQLNICTPKPSTWKALSISIHMVLSHFIQKWNNTTLTLSPCWALFICRSNISPYYVLPTFHFVHDLLCDTAVPVRIGMTGLFTHLPTASKTALVVKSVSHVQLFLTPCTIVSQAS